MYMEVIHPVYSQRDQYLLNNNALGKKEKSGVQVEIDSWKSKSS